MCCGQRSPRRRSGPGAEARRDARVRRRGALVVHVRRAQRAVHSPRALAWQEAGLRLALLGGLATSVLQLAVCGGPLVSWGAAAAMFAAPPIEPVGAPAAAAPEVALSAVADAAPAFPTDLLLLAVA